MRSFRLSLRWQLILFSLALVIVPIAALGIISYVSVQSEMYAEFEREMQREALIISQNVRNIYEVAQMKVTSDLQVARDIFTSYGTTYINDTGEMVLIDAEREAQVQRKVNSDLIVAHTIMYGKGNPVLDSTRTLSVDAMDQISKEVTTVGIPTMRVGGRQVAFDYQIVDEIKNTTGVETATIFQVIPQGILRISTNVMKLDNTRAVGTYIPTNSPVYQTVMAGDTYYGRAFVVNAWYQTAYEPIFAANGAVIGVLYVGARESAHIVNDNFTIVDKIRELVGGTATVFQLKDFEGERQNDQTSAGWAYDEAFYRISTNVQKLDGTRAVGTIVSKPVHDTIMAGDSFFGRAWVVNAWYQTAYEPIRDASGSIVGILYVGVLEDDFQETLKSNLAEIVVGKTGYIYILNEKGEYVLSLNRQRDGENIWGSQDADGSFFIQEIVNTGMALGEGETAIIYYPWQNLGENRPRMKFAGYAYFPEWKWVVASSAYVEDFEGGLARIQTLTIIIAVIAIVVGMVVSFLFAISISRPLTRLTAVSNSIADGDFGAEMPTIRSRNEIGTLAASFRRMIDSLSEKSQHISRIARGDLSAPIAKVSDQDRLGEELIQMQQSLTSVLSQVNVAVDQVTAGSDQVSQASQSLSQGASEQASSLEEVSSSLSEINAQAGQNAESAQEASSLSKSSAENAQQGNQQMQDLVVTMAQINDSADQIKNVVKVIDDIAFQINLLALNANVEAARAGKYGKGFAVVADEVRNLAVRSADAVKQTTAMVDESIRNAEQGNQVARTTADKLNEIVSGFGKVAELLSEIALASKEQAQGIEQIDNGLEQIDSVTQANTASAEQSASAAEELASQAIELKSMVSRFVLSEIQRPARKATTLSPAPRAPAPSRLEAPNPVAKPMPPTPAQSPSPPRPPMPAPVVGHPNEEADLDEEPSGEQPDAPVDPRTIIDLDDDDFGKF